LDYLKDKLKLEDGLKNKLRNELGGKQNLFKKELNMDLGTSSIDDETIESIMKEYPNLNFIHGDSDYKEPKMNHT